MIALCRDHHQASDDGAISRSELYIHKENPANEKAVDYEFHFNPHSPIILLGSEFIVEVGSPGTYKILQVQDQPIISIQYSGDRLMFDIHFFDKSNELVAEITENEWWADTEKFWDIKYQSNRLKLWNKKYEIGLYIEHHPKQGVMSFRGRFIYNGREFYIFPKSVQAYGGNSEMASIGAVLGVDDDYQTRISTDQYAVMNPTFATEGVFIIDGENDNFIFSANDYPG
jgi:hypothetical protein